MFSGRSSSVNPKILLSNGEGASGKDAFIALSPRQDQQAKVDDRPLVWSLSQPAKKRSQEELKALYDARRQRQETDDDANAPQGAAASSVDVGGVTIPRLWSDGNAPRVQSTSESNMSTRRSEQDEDVGHGGGSDVNKVVFEGLGNFFGRTQVDLRCICLCVCVSVWLCMSLSVSLFLVSDNQASSPSSLRAFNFRICEQGATVMTPLPPSGTQTLENASSGPTKQILPSSSPIPQPLKLNGSSNHVNTDLRGGAGILAGVSRLLPAAFVTAEVGFGAPGSSGTDTNDFHASNLMSLNRPPGSYKDSRKAQMEEQQQLRQALFHRYANGNDIPIASDPVEGVHTRTQELPDNGAGGRLSSMMASMKSSVAGLMTRSRWETEGHFHGATVAPSAMSNPGWRSLSMHVSRPPTLFEPWHLPPCLCVLVQYKDSKNPAVLAYCPNPALCGHIRCILLSFLSWYVQYVVMSPLFGTDLMASSRGHLCPCHRTNLPIKSYPDRRALTMKPRCDYAPALALFLSLCPFPRPCPCLCPCLRPSVK